MEKYVRNKYWSIIRGLKIINIFSYWKLLDATLNILETVILRFRYFNWFHFDIVESKNLMKFNKRHGHYQGSLLRQRVFQIIYKPLFSVIYFFLSNKNPFVYSVGRMNA